MISHFFIDRPIFASVLSIVIVVIGLVALRALPIAQFPEITPPVVQVEADYPGANAEIVADSVARPIEVQLPGIDNLLYYDSTSTNDGHMSIKLTFEIGTNVDIAQVQTQNRVKLAEPQLPPEVVRQGISINKVSPDLLAVVALSSTDPTHDTVYLSNYAILRVLDNLKRLPGVGNAVVFGSQNYSMRLILDPIRMAQLSLTPTDVSNVVREQNRDFPAGTIGREPALKGTELTIPVITQGRLTEVKDFEDLIVRALPQRLDGPLEGRRSRGVGSPVLYIGGAMERQAECFFTDLSLARRECAGYGQAGTSGAGQSFKKLSLGRLLRHSL